ncbi:MAG TPA: PadR family transcriptional regulator [bacterium]|nr:PadR family transcriptional regulator [bacterium]
MADQEYTVQLRKGVLEIAVLLLITEKALYGYEIITQLERYGLEVVQGTLYPLLTRLHKEGLVDYSWEESQQGPPRKYYQLTEKGSEKLHAMVHDWKQMMDSMKKLLAAWKA